MSLWVAKPPLDFISIHWTRCKPNELTTPPFERERERGADDKYEGKEKPQGREKSLGETTRSITTWPLEERAKRERGKKGTF